MILDPRPHRLSYLVQGQGQTLPGGDYQPAPAEWQGLIPCNGVPAGRVAERTFDDGITRRYSYTIDLDTTARDFELGERIRLDTRSGRVELEVKGYARYQTYCRIWA